MNAETEQRQASALAELWPQFTRYGSGWTLEAERDYKAAGSPLIYHLRMFGVVYPDHYELVGDDPPTLLRQAIADGDAQADPEEDHGQPAQ